MLPCRADAAFKESIFDAEEEIYSPTQRRKAMGAALKQFSRYKPLTRRYGGGQAFSGATTDTYPNDDPPLPIIQVGSTFLEVSGGPFAAGAVILVGYATPNVEPLIVLANLGPTQKAEWNPCQSVILQLASATTKLHVAGDLVYQMQMGLTVIAGQDVYLLPTDFMDVEPDTFAVATGERVQFVRTGGFYDSAYSDQESYSGAGWGAMQNYGPSAYPLSMPNPTLNGWQSSTAAAGGQQLWTITEGDPPTLLIYPVPAASITLDFQYQAIRNYYNIQDDQLDDIIHYGRYSIYTAWAGKLASYGDFSEDDVHETYSANAKALGDLAQSELKEWLRTVANRPRITSG